MRWCVRCASARASGINQFPSLLLRRRGVCESDRVALNVDGAASCSAVQETAAQRTYLAATQKSHSGSIYGVGGRFQSFRINDLEMVDQTGIEPVTS